MPRDLAITADEPDTTAADLHLLEDPEDEDSPDGRLLLVQLPAVLPIHPPAAGGASSSGDAGDAGQPSTSAAAGGAAKAAAPRRGGAAAGGAGGTANEAGVPLKSLPSGKIGKLLVFESGAVKLRIGDVLFDVLSGQPVRCRQVRLE